MTDQVFVLGTMVHLCCNERYTFAVIRCVSWCFEPSQPQRITSGLMLQ